MNGKPATQALLIEDNPGDARLIQETLRAIPGRPFEAQAVSTLTEGLERLRGETFALVLLDLGLPDSQGRDSVLKVRNLNPDLALVVLTGLNDERVAVEALQSGAQDYLIKGDYQLGQLGRSLRYAIERKQAEIALREARLNEELEREAERQRIAMDLHDGVIQDIYGVALSLETMLGETSGDSKSFDQTIERNIEQLHEVLIDIRRYIFELRPGRFTGNLEADLRNMAQQFESGSDIRTVVTAAQALPQLDGAVGVALFHIAHEALSNARKHASPSQITISATGTSDLLLLEVSDDGTGFDTTTLLPDRHRGLRNMAARAASIGATLSISSSPGKGTSIRIELQVVRPSTGWSDGQVA